jgi:hypothetical protein
MLYIRYDDGRIEVAPRLLPDQRPRWTATIHLTPDLHLTIVDMRTTSHTPHFTPPTVRPYSVPILKSNLQKCVRRHEGTRGLATGWQLLCQNPTEMLRRLPVIIPEDSLVHPRLYPELVWLMAAASKGYCLTWADAAAIMAALATAIETPARAAIYATPSEPAPPTRSALSLALLIRAEFGGMDHDRDFLRRLATRDDLPTDAAAPIWIEHDIDPFVPTTHILLEAIDQHCCPFVVREILGLHPQAIWWCRSSLNSRPIVGSGATAEEAAKRAEFAANLEAHRDALDIFSHRQIVRGWATSPSPSRQPSATTGPLDTWVKRVQSEKRK